MSLQAVNSQISDTLTPRDFGDVQTEYEALQTGAAINEIPFPGILEISGKNAVAFINGLVTNNIKDLKPSEGILAAFLNTQGKVEAICRFYRTGEKLLIEMDGNCRERIFKNLSRFVPAGDFFLHDLSEKFSLFSLQGPKSAALLSSLTGQTIELQPEYRNWQIEIQGYQTLITAHSRSLKGGFDLFVPKESKIQTLQSLIERGAQPAGSEAMEIARLEAGIPRENVDVNENNILLEAGYEKAVSYTKGCYLGQEIIARIHWRGQPAKQLKGLLIDSQETPAKGTELWAADGKKVGEITSTVKSLALNRIIGLGYVHRYYVAAGTSFTLKLQDIETGTATISETPFVK